MAIMNESQPFKLSSFAFSQGGEIPRQYTCEGDNISPPLKWENPPAGTKSYVLIMDDPDAPGQTWIHWVLFNIPANVSGFEKNVICHLDGAKPGRNS